MRVFFLFQIKNPFFRNTSFKNLFWGVKNITKYKTLEWQLTNNNDMLFEIEMDICFRGTDHAGPRLSLTICGYNFIINLYDIRHWDYKNNKWIEN